MDPGAPSSRSCRAQPSSPASSGAPIRYRAPGAFLRAATLLRSGLRRPGSIVDSLSPTERSPIHESMSHAGIAATLAVPHRDDLLRRRRGRSPAMPGTARAAAAPANPTRSSMNRTLLQLLQTPGAQPATVQSTRSMAIVHLAIYDAVNAIVAAMPHTSEARGSRAASPMPPRRRRRTRSCWRCFRASSRRSSEVPGLARPSRWRRARPSNTYCPRRTSFVVLLRRRRDDIVVDRAKTYQDLNRGQEHKQGRDAERGRRNAGQRTRFHRGGGN